MLSLSSVCAGCLPPWYGLCGHSSRCTLSGQHGQHRPLLAGLLGEASLRVLRGQLGQCLVPVREPCSGSLCPPLGPVGVSRWSAHRESSSYVGPTSFLVCRCSDGTLPLWQALGSSEYTLSCHSSPSSGSLHTANPGPLPGSDLWRLRWSTQPSPTIADKNLRLGVQGSGAKLLCMLLFILPSSIQVTLLSS